MRDGQEMGFPRCPLSFPRDALAWKGDRVQIRKGILWAIVLGLIFGVARSVPAGSRLSDVTVEHARELIQARSGKSDFMILDVRTPKEFAEGHLSGAVNVNALGPDFEAQLSKLDRARTYLVYCRMGNRSARAIQVMSRMGFRSVYHMFEGIMGWYKRALPLSRSL